MWEDEAVQSIASYYRMWSLALTWVTGVAIYLQILSDIFSQSLQRPTIFPRRWNWKIIVTIWKVVFANKSRTLGWIWMKLGRWSWGLKRLSLARFQRNRAMGFGKSAKMWVAEAFLWGKRRTTSATFLGSISAILSTNTCAGGGSRHMVSYSRQKFH